MTRRRACQCVASTRWFGCFSKAKAAIRPSRLFLFIPQVGADFNGALRAIARIATDGVATSTGDATDKASIVAAVNVVFGTPRGLVNQPGAMTVSSWESAARRARATSRGASARCGDEAQEEANTKEGRGVGVALSIARRQGFAAGRSWPR